MNKIKYFFRKKRSFSVGEFGVGVNMGDWAWVHIQGSYRFTVLLINARSVWICNRCIWSNF